MVNKKALLTGATVLAVTMILSSFAVALITTSGANAQLNAEDYQQVEGIYLNITGLEGESIDTNHEKWIDILSYDWNESGGSVSRPGAGARRVVPGDFHFVKMYDKSSPTLFLYCAQGKLIPSAQLDVTKVISETNVRFIRYRFDNLVISFYGTSGEIDGSSGVLDEFSFNFAKLTVTYTPFIDGTPVGDVIATYNYVTNTGS